MELKQLKFFIKLAEKQSFTEAANALSIQQSTLSQQIKALENDLKISLFDRGLKGVTLTEAGLTFLPHAKRTVAASEHGLQCLRNLEKQRVGTLNIGVNYTLGHLLTNAIIKFSKDFPDVYLNIVYKPVKDLVALLKKRELDFVLAYRPLDDDYMICHEDLFNSKLSIIANKHHPVAGLREFSLENINKYPLALPSAGSQARSMIDNMLERYHSNIFPQIELNNMTILMNLVETGNWISVLSESAILGHANLKAIHIADRHTEMHPSLLWYKSEFQKYAAQEFMKILRSESANLFH